MIDQQQLPPEVEIQGLKDTVQALIQQRNGSLNATLNENAQLAVQVQTLMRKAQEDDAKIKELEAKVAEMTKQLEQPDLPLAKTNGKHKGGISPAVQA